MADKILIGRTTISDHIVADMLQEEFDHCAVFPCQYERDPAEALKTFDSTEDYDCVILIWEDPCIDQERIDEVYKKWRAALPDILFVVVSSEEMYAKSDYLLEEYTDDNVNMTWFSFDPMYLNLFQALVEHIGVKLHPEDWT